MGKTPKKGRVDLNKTQTLQEISLLLITCSVDEWIWLLTPMTEVCLSIILYESVKNATEQNYPAFFISDGRGSRKRLWGRLKR